MRTFDTKQRFATYYTNPPKRQPSHVSGESLTQQHFADECDINKIMERYRQTGYLTNPLQRPTREATFGDFTQVTDYQQAQAIVLQAQEQFMSLPATVREEFQNSPARFLEFMNDMNEEQAKKAEMLGLVQVRTPSKQADGSLDGDGH